MYNFKNLDKLIIKFNTKLEKGLIIRQDEELFLRGHFVKRYPSLGIVFISAGYPEVKLYFIHNKPIIEFFLRGVGLQQDKNYFEKIDYSSCKVNKKEVFPKLKEGYLRLLREVR